MKLIPDIVQAGPLRIHFLPMPTSDVVTWRGSFRTEPNAGAGEEMLQELAVSLLDKGTGKRDRFEIAEFLENRGARLGFRSEGFRVRVSGKALRTHATEVIALMAEMLREPLFDADELEKMRDKLTASLRRSRHHTGHQAAIGLAQALYRPGHPNYAFGVDEEIVRLSEFTADDVARYYKRHLLPDTWNIVFSGDLDVATLQSSMTASLGDWRGLRAEAVEIPAVVENPVREVRVPISDRDNLDVRMGQSLDLRRDHPDYVPLFVANFVLGGNFSARLMTDVRDERGLTYGIGSALVGIEPGHSGHFQIAATLSKEHLYEGLEAIGKVLTQWVDEGTGTDELVRQKPAICGSFKVRLSTTAGVAGALLHGLERNLGDDYLERFPQEVEAVDLQRVNSVVRKYLDPQVLVTSLAGTFPDATVGQGDGA